MEYDLELGLRRECEPRLYALGALGGDLSCDENGNGLEESDGRELELLRLELMREKDTLVPKAGSLGLYRYDRFDTILCTPMSTISTSIIGFWSCIEECREAKKEESESSNRFYYILSVGIGC
jgi:hypothetical protein